MPQMTGDQLASALFRVRSDLPIIRCTGFVQKLTEEEAHHIGVRRLLLKPLSVQQVVQTVREILNERA